MIYPVILAGGAGTRLWPLSRESYPKQLLALAGGHTGLQAAALLAADRRRFHAPIVMANVDHRFVVAEQLRQANVPSARIVLEPCRRDTAAAAAVAALLAARDDADALILLIPASCVTAGAEELRHAVEAARDAAVGGALVRFAPAGLFLAAAATVIGEFEALAPKVIVAARTALEAAIADLDFLRLGEQALSGSPVISFEDAVVSRSDRVLEGPAVSCGEAATWSLLGRLSEADGDGNVRVGDVCAEDATGSYLRSEGPLVAAIGVKDLVVVATGDAVLVAHRDHAEAVGGLVERLKSSDHVCGFQTRRVHRPWGWYEGLLAGERFQVKQIMVQPGGQLSLQKHFHRAEHWVVVNGEAEVQVGEACRLVGENEAVFVPLGAVHRLKNPGKTPLNLIEVQSGDYLGEDDIVRLADVYARS